jgi:AcrR family transcriptional regulator
MNVRQRVDAPARADARKAKAKVGHADGPQKANARDRILNAVLSITKTCGVAHLSLEAIARQASVSKGGLLYHFPTKKALMRALVEYHLALTDQAIADAETSARSPNAVAAALVDVHERLLEMKPLQGPDAALAAFVEDPSLFDPIRLHHQRIAARIRKSAADPDLSLIALLALEGMKTHDVLALDYLKSDERKRLFKRIKYLLCGGAKEGA